MVCKLKHVAESDDSQVCENKRSFLFIKFEVTRWVFLQNISPWQRVYIQVILPTSFTSPKKVFGTWYLKVKIDGTDTKRSVHINQYLGTRAMYFSITSNRRYKYTFNWYFFFIVNVSFRGCTLGCVEWYLGMYWTVPSFLFLMVLSLKISYDAVVALPRMPINRAKWKPL